MNILEGVFGKKKEKDNKRLITATFPRKEGVGYPFMGKLEKVEYEAWAHAVREIFGYDNLETGDSMSKKRFSEIFEELYNEEKLHSQFYSFVSPRLVHIVEMSKFGIDLKDFDGEPAIRVRPCSQLAQLIFP